MRRFFMFAALLVFVVSCGLDDDGANFTLQTLPVKSAEVPDEFTYNKEYNITVTYDLPDGCHSFHSLFFQQENDERTVAINAIVDLRTNCTQAVVEESFTFEILALQREDYVFKFWKGVNGDGENIFEEVVVPVNE